MKILNAYSGIGGNRKLWGDEHQVTAVEYNEAIAAIYQDLWPEDEVVVADAHEYILKHHHEFDFIWSSPPCPSHSQVNSFLYAQGVVRYPDMSLWQEIIFLKSFYGPKCGGKAMYVEMYGYGWRLDYDWVFSCQICDYIKSCPSGNILGYHSWKERDERNSWI